MKNNEESIEIDTSCLRVVEGILEGESNALAETYQRFAYQLVQKAERSIPSKFRSKILAESIVHSVMESFMAIDALKKRRLENYRIENWAQLYGLLARMVMCKLMNRIRVLNAQKRVGDMGASVQTEELASHQPSPQDELIYVELINNLFGHFSDIEKEIIQQRMSGMPVDQISQQSNLTTTTVKSILRKLQRKVQKMLDEESA